MAARAEKSSTGRVRLSVVIREVKPPPLSVDGEGADGRSAGGGREGVRNRKA